LEYIISFFLLKGGFWKGQKKRFGMSLTFGMGFLTILGLFFHPVFMPIIQSAKKQLRQSLKKRVLNARVTRTLKESIKAVTKAVKDNSPEKAEETLRVAYKTIDTAAKKHLLHPNNANRKKSNLAKWVKGMGAAAAAREGMAAKTKKTDAAKNNSGTKTGGTKKSAAVKAAATKAKAKKATTKK
jgi:small subunit ribosomal protein S20